MKEKYFKKRFYTHCIKTNTKPPSSNPIIISDNKDINKPSSLSFYADMVMEDKNTKNTKNKEDLKNLQLSYSKSPLSSVDENVLNNPSSKSNVSPRTERPAKRRKKTVLKYKQKAKEGRTFTTPHITKELLQREQELLNKLK